MKKVRPIFLALCVAAAGLLDANAIAYQGIEFPNGAISFADSIVSYAPGTGVSSPNNNSSAALGTPDHTGGSGKYVSLGEVGGTLVVQFTNNSLTTNGNSNEDLWIFEIGARIEPVGVEVSTNGSNWISVGSTIGGTSGVDIDAFTGAGIVLGELYSFVRLTEIDPSGFHDSGSPWAGADIDAIGAISSAQAHVPDGGATLLLLGVALGALRTVKNRRA